MLDCIGAHNRNPMQSLCNQLLNNHDTHPLAQSGAGGKGGRLATGTGLFEKLAASGDAVLPMSQMINEVGELAM